MHDRSKTPHTRGAPRPVRHRGNGRFCGIWRDTTSRTRSRRTRASSARPDRRRRCGARGRRRHARLRRRHPRVPPSRRVRRAIGSVGNASKARRHRSGRRRPRNVTARSPARADRRPRGLARRVARASRVAHARPRARGAGPGFRQLGRARAPRRRHARGRHDDHLHGHRDVRRRRRAEDGIGAACRVGRVPAFGDLLGSRRRARPLE